MPCWEQGGRRVTEIWLGAALLLVLAALFLVFPGWLKHFVHPYRGSRPRVSIAFNVKIEPKRTHQAD